MNLVAPLLRRIQECLLLALHRAHILIEDIEQLIFVGDGSKLALISDTIGRLFGNER